MARVRCAMGGRARAGPLENRGEERGWKSRVEKNERHACIMLYCACACDFRLHADIGVTSMVQYSQTFLSN